MLVSVMPATDRDFAELVVRQADVDEFLAGYNETPEQGIARAKSASAEVLAGRIDGQLVCIFGVAPYGLLSGKWAPWLVGTDAMYGHQREFIAHCRPVLAAMLARYRRLENYVDARNTAAIRWLRWLGFVIHDPEPFGYAGLPFHRFTLES